MKTLSALILFLFASNLAYSEEVDPFEDTPFHCSLQYDVGEGFLELEHIKVSKLNDMRWSIRFKDPVEQQGDVVVLHYNIGEDFFDLVLVTGLKLVDTKIKVTKIESDIEGMAAYWSANFAYTDFNEGVMVKKYDLSCTFSDNPSQSIKAE